MNRQKIAEIPFIYDAIQFFFGKPIIDERLKTFIERSSLNSTSYVLDLGGGTGLNRHLIHQTNRYICLDLDLEKISTSLKRQEHNSSIMADACQIPLKNSSVDLVMLTAVTHHIPDTAIPALFSEILRVLTPDGQFLLFDPIVDSRNPLGRFFLKYDLGAFPRTVSNMDDFLLKHFTPIFHTTFRILHSYLLFVGTARKGSEG